MAAAMKQFCFYSQHGRPKTKSIQPRFRPADGQDAEGRERERERGRKRDSKKEKRSTCRNSSALKRLPLHPSLPSPLSSQPAPPPLRGESVADRFVSPERPSTEPPADESSMRWSRFTRTIRAGRWPRAGGRKSSQ